MPGMQSDGSITIDTKLDNTGFTKGSEKLKQAVQSMISQVNALGGKLKNAIGPLGNALKASFSAVTTAIKAGSVSALAGVRMGTLAAVAAAMRATSAFKEMAGGVVLGGLKKLGGALQTIAGNLLALAKNAFSAAVGYIKSAVQEGVKDLAQVNANFNASMSSLMTALNTLKGSFVAAFSPLLQYVEPVLTRFIYLVAEAVNNVGMLIAALTGKEFVKAVPVQQDYADSLKNTSEKEKEARDALKEQKKAMDKDRKAAKKLNKALEKTISNFDDINILKDNRDDDDDFDFDTDVSIPETPKVDYITQPVDNGFLDFAQKLKDMFKNADFTDLGRMLGEKLRDALNKIPWDKIKDAAKKVAKSIATLLNGFLETPGLFEAIGRTLAEALNTAFEFLNSFAENFHFASLGSAIGKAINSALQTIDWPLIYETFRNWGTGLAEAINAFLYETDFTLIGETLGHALSGIYYFVYEFASTLDWAAVGQSIKDALLGLASSIDWEGVYSTYYELGKGMGTAIQNAVNDPAIWTALFEALSNGIKTSLILLNEFVQGINWTDMGTNIGIGMNNGVESFDWNLLSQTLINLINGAFDLWYNWVTTFDFKKFGTHIGNTLADTVNGINWEEGGAAVGATIEGLFAALDGFVEGMDWKALGQAVVDTIAGFFGEFDWSTVGSLLSSCFAALLDFFTGAIEEVDWLQVPTIITQKIGDFLSGFDWGETASAAMELLGAALAGAIQLVGGLGLALYNWIADGLKGMWDYFGTEIDDAGGNVALGILNGIAQPFVDLGKWLVDNVFTPFVEGLKSVFGIDSPATTMLEFGGYIIEGVLQGIINGLIDIIGWLTENVFNPIVDGFKTLFGIGEADSSVFLGLGGQIISGLLNGIIEGLSDIAAWIDTNIFTPIVEGVKTLFGIGEGDSTVFSGFGGQLISGLLTGITNGLSDIANWINTNVFTPITEGFKTLFEIGADGISAIFSGFGGSLIEGLKSGLSSAVGGISDWIGTNITGPITDGFKTLFGIGADGISSVFSGFGGNLIDGLKTGLSDAAANAGGWIESNVTGPISGFFKDLFGIHSPSTVFNGYGGELMAGLEQGVEENEDLPKNALTNAQTKMKDVFGALKELLAWAALGSKIMEVGLKAGILLKTPEIVAAVQNLEKEMRAVFSDNYTNWHTSAVVLMDQFKNGVTSKTGDLANAMSGVTSVMRSRTESESYTFHSTGQTLMNSMTAGAQSASGEFTSMGPGLATKFSQNTSGGANWWELGSSIIHGIYNGVLANSGSLYALAWNTASEMYASACRALGIASPSKKFYWIAEMVTEGMANGIEDTKGTATDAVSSLAGAIIDTAEEANPIIPVSAGMDEFTAEFGGVLTSFADRVTDSFANLISSMERIASGSSFVVPAVATGTAVPYAVNAMAASRGQSSGMEDAMRVLATQASDRLTRNDLVEVLTNVCRQYMNFSFYISDEQIARHNMAGSLELQRRGVL